MPLVCEIGDFVYSWIGAAALGGYLGKNAAAFASGVISGVAGAYQLGLPSDAVIDTDQVIQLGQIAQISGDLAHARPPNCGTCGFIVGENAQLSLFYITLAGDTTFASALSSLTLSMCISGDGSMSLPRSSGRATRDANGVESNTLAVFHLSIPTTYWISLDVLTRNANRITTDVAGNIYKLALMPPTTFTESHGQHRYDDLCVVAGMRQIVTGNSQAGVPEYYAQWNCLSGDRA